MGKADEVLLPTNDCVRKHERIDVMKLLLVVFVSCFLSNYNSAQEQPTKENKEEVLYKGKPASFWIKQLKDRDASFRLDAVKALREIGTDGEGVVLALVQTFADKEQSVRDAAREAIASIPLKGKIPALIGILREKDKSARPDAVDLLGNIGSQAKDAVPDLTKILDDEDADIRARAAKALGKIGVPEKTAIAALVRLLDDKVSTVRLASIEALGGIEKETDVAIPSLLERLLPKKEEDASIRLAAMKTLWAIGKQHDKVLLAILVACNDDDPGVSKQARTTISGLEVKRRIPILAQSLKHEDNKIRVMSMQFLVEAGADAKEAVPAVVEALKSDDDALRIQAAKMLAKVGKDAAPATPSLIGLLADKSAQVRLESAEALKAIPIGGKLPALIAALKDKNAATRAYAVGELAEVGPDAKAAVPALVTLLEEKDVRVSAAKALGKIGLDAKDAIPSLSKLLDEEDEVMRTTALTALRNLGPDAKVPVLIGSLRDKEPEVRQTSATEIAKIGPKANAAIPALIKALDDPNSKVCVEVASALTAMGKESVAPLVEFLKSESKNRAFAVKALGEIGTEANVAVPLLEKFLQGDDEVLRSAATAALRNMGPKARFGSLIGSLKDNNRRLSADAARELGTMGPEAKSAIPTLVSVYIKAHAEYQYRPFDEGWLVLDTYETALKRLGTHDVPLLLETLTKNRDNPLVVAVVASTLAEIGLPDAKAAVPVFIELLKEKKCRVSAALALGQMGGPDAKAAILPLLETLKGYSGECEGHESYLTGKYKTEEFARREDRKMRPRLQLGKETAKLDYVKEAQMLVKDEQRPRDNKRVRKNAIAVLRAMGKAAIPLLLETLQRGGENGAIAVVLLVELHPDEAKEATDLFVNLLQDEGSRHAAAYALGKINGPKAKEAIPFLVDLLGDGDELVQEATAAIIKNIGKDAVPLVMELLKEKGSRKTLAMGALGEIGPDAKAAAPILLKLLQEDCREAAALALGRIGGPDAKATIPILTKFFEDGDELMQRAAATALGKVGKDAVPSLLKILQGENRHRFLAAYALGEIGSDAKTAIPVLIGLLEDDDKVLRMTAATALGKLGKDAVPALMAVLKGKSKNRLLAVYSLGGIGSEAGAAVPLLLDIIEKDRQGGHGELALKPGDAKLDKEFARSNVFLNPALQKVTTFDVLLDADPTPGFSAALALAKIGGSNSKAAIPVFVELLAPTLQAQAQDKKAEGKAGKDPFRNEKRASSIGPVLQTLKLERTEEDEDSIDGWYSKARKKEAEKDRLVELAAIGALKSLGKDAVPSLIESLKDRGTLPIALALVRISPDAAKDLAVSLMHTDRKYRWYGEHWDNPIADEELRELVPFKRMSELKLDRTKVTDIGLKAIPNFKNLSRLSLDSTTITNKGLKAIAGLEGLTVLEIGGTKVTDAGLTEIAKLKNLRALDLGGTKVTDRRLSDLAELPHLSSLGLAHTDITNAGLKELVGFKHLTLLDLRGTQVTGAGVAELSKALPGTRILK